MKQFIIKISKILILLMLILYLILLVKLIVLKDGLGYSLHMVRGHLSMSEKLKSANFIPFSAIYNTLKEPSNFSLRLDNNLIGNILAFGPLGFLLPIVFNNFKKLKNTLIAAILLSVCFETIQLVFSFGACDIDDVILNLLGALIGFGIYKILNKKHKNLFNRLTIFNNNLNTFNK